MKMTQDSQRFLIRHLANYVTDLDYFTCDRPKDHNCDVDVFNAEGAYTALLELVSERREYFADWKNDICS